MKYVRKRRLITVLTGAAVLLFVLLWLAPRLIGHAGDERTVAIMIVSIEDDWATAEAIRNDAPFFARLPHEIVFNTKILGSMAEGLEPGERFQAMYLYSASRGKQVKVMSVLKEDVPLTFSGFGEE